ncbi:helicase-related protein [Citricoccus sp. I39-566]|uniref:helicase-related protein n=1 Tax=Citricoccus sp. I39-566 TaxID=3073268 RepID=UPI002869FA0F|nr:helicase-related protein [Citricoccus sp. I39-566]WMY80092.1 helicase-related protein [Citricoccus sp. I39-566]
MANVAALQTLAELEDAGRHATAADQDELSRWSSWGALPEVFDDTAEAFSAEDRALVRELLGPEGWEQAKATTLNAHYTDPAHAQAIWGALSRAGFDGGRVLEPGCGSGEFIGQAPAGARMVGVELDATTARIAAHLHPSHEVHAAGFEQVRLGEDSFHAVVGNVPFGAFPVADAKYNGQNLSIHNYFIAKSLRLTAPGGYVAVMTSTWTMDAQRASARREFARYADLVGAVRLPNGAMQDSAGTDVKTDVLIFRRREPGAKIDQDAVAAWVEPAVIEAPDRDGEVHQVPASRYFRDHPQNVLGTLRAATDPWGGMSYRVDPPADGELDTLLAERLGAVVDAAKDSGLGYSPDPLPVEHRPGLHFPPVAEAAVGHVRFDPATGGFVRYGAQLQWEPVKVPRARGVEARALLVLRDQAVQVMRAQSEGRGPEAAEAAREKLRTGWQQYVDAYGPINRSEDIWKTPRPQEQAQKVRELEAQWRATLPEDGEMDRSEVPVPDELAAQWAAEAAVPEFSHRRQPHLEFLSGDPKLGLLRACEVFDDQEQTAEPAALLTRDVIEYRPRPERAESVQDAIAISLDETRTVDVDRVAGLLGVDADEAEAQMAGHVFTDPESGVLVPRVTYLSGNVRAKLAAAEQGLANGGDFAVNVAALEAVLPADVDIRDVVVNPGVHWVPQEIYEDFVRDTFEVATEVKFNPAVEAWEVASPKGGFSPSVRYQWGTNKRTPAALLAATMNYKAVVVREKDADGTYRKDEAATTAAREKVDAIRSRFNAWVTEDPARAARLQGLYNEAFNSMVAPDYDQMGQRLELPGLEADRKPYSYQRSAVARAVNEPAVLLDHVVGAGKTGTMVMAAMELRRTGIAHRPAMVVPNHLVEQINREFVEWYPDANVLAVPTGLTPAQRRDWMAMAAAGDWDAIIMPQTVFERVEIDPAKRAEWLAEQLAELDELITASEGGMSVKRVEAAKKRVQAAYDKATRITDPGITFEETGIDYLFVDEAHHYKNLARTSDLGELACQGSNRATDLDFKLRALRERKTLSAQRAGVATSTYLPAVATFATGTPVSNNMSEMWVMQHYLRPDLLQAAAVESVTAWGQQFTKSQTTLKPKMTGDGFDQVTKIGQYVNMPELMGLNRTFTDTVQRDQLEAKLPTVLGGDRILLRREPSEQVREYIDELADRIENLSGFPEPGADNMLKIMGDGRKVALDGRLVGLDPDEDGGRAVAVAEQVMEVHERTHDRQYTTATGEVSEVRGGLQIIFCDQSTPREDQWNIYHELRDQLTARGMAAEKIAFIHDAETDEARQEMFTQARQGQLSVIIGSTAKMGTGTNIQRRAIALHHVDCPWRPADLEQREGRVIRQGNQNAQVEIYSYATEKTFDVASWDMIARKARFISQMKRGDLAGREVEDAVADLEFSASKAAAELSGDPRIEQLATLQMRIEQLTSLEASWRNQRSATRAELRMNQNRVQHLQGMIPKLEAVTESVTSTEGDRFRFTRPDGAGTADRMAAGQVIAAALRRQAARTDRPDFLEPTDPEPVGTLGGVRLGVVRSGNTVQLVPMGLPSVHKSWPVAKLLGEDMGPRSAVQSAEAFVAGLGGELSRRRTELEKLQESIPAVEQALTQPFEHAAELENLKREAADLAEEMAPTTEGADETPVELSGQDLAKLGNLERTDHREGDVWNAGRAYWRVGIHTDERSGRKHAMCWPAEEDRPADLTTATPAFSVLRSGTLIARMSDQLVPLEREMLELDTTRHQRVDHLWQVPAQARVRIQARDGQIVEGNIDNRQSLTTDTGERIRINDLDTGPGIILVDATSPEQIAAEQAAAAAKARQRTAHDFLPGEVLGEDVEHFGYAGDVVRLERYGYGSYRPVAVSPDTGRAREGTPWRVESREWQTTPPTRLTEAERTQLYGSPRFTTPVQDLRPGDVVVATDIDNHAQTREPVTITGISGDTTVNLRYRNEQVTGEGKKRAESEVTVLDRTHGALTGHELLTLARPGADLPRVELRELAAQAPAGAHVLLDVPTHGEVAGGLVPGRLTGVEQEHHSGAMGRRITVHQLVVQTSDGATVKVPARADGHATLTQTPVTLAELQFAPVPEATAHTPAVSTIPAGTTVTGDVYQRATTPSPAPETPTGQETVPAREAGLDPALAYHLQASAPPTAAASRGLA